MIHRMIICRLEDNMYFCSMIKRVDSMKKRVLFLLPFLSLDGNGAELKAFQLQNGEEMKTELRYEKTEVTTEGNLTDEEKGQLRFKDGVTKTKVLVHATIEHVDKNGDVQLSFYLSSKAECEGAQEVIDLRTEVKEEK